MQQSAPNPPRRPRAQPARRFVTLTLPDALRAAYEAGETRPIRDYIADQLAEPVAFDVLALPSRGWSLALAEGAGLGLPRSARPDRVTVTLGFADERAARGFGRGLRRNELALGTDPPIAAAEAWCPAEAGGATFGTRRDALARIGAERLAQDGLDGTDTYVVVFDRGIDRRRVPAANWLGGWRFTVPPELADQFPGETVREPGEAPFGHGNMIVRNVLSVAPRARILDCPVLPPAILDVPAFLSVAQAGWQQVLADIAALRQAGVLTGRWVLCNPWNVYDLRADRVAPAADRYGDNGAHPFNLAVEAADAAGVDVVVSAGNCGQFCPDRRCGQPDIGLGRSVFGAAAHPGALSVGAVRADGLWLGYSSQGPGALAHTKPDLVLPSEFAEDDDAGLPSRGTSAACGLAAGVIAALRTGGVAASQPKQPNAGPGQPGTTPDALRATLTKQTKGGKVAWSPRTGFGLLDLRAL